MYLYSETDSRRDPLSWLDGQAAARNELGSIQGPRGGHQSIKVMLVVFVTDLHSELSELPVTFIGVLTIHGCSNVSAPGYLDWFAAYVLQLRRRRNFSAHHQSCLIN